MALVEVLLYLAMGLGLGLLTSMPIGVANVAVVDVAVRQGWRRALGLAAGAATADLLHAGVAFAGLAPLLAGHPPWSAIFFVLSGAGIAAYGLHVMRSVPVTATSGHMARSYLVGLLLTLSNPAALLAWLMVAGAMAPGSARLGAMLACGVGIGAFAWFSLLALLVARGRDLLKERKRRLSRVLGSALILLGVLSLLRGVQQLWP